MNIEDLKGIKAPFDVVDKGGQIATVKGFTQNDPLGVGGGLFPDMPTVYFEGGGWILLEDLLNNYELDKEVLNEQVI